jgi:hypothetical protein
MLALVIVLPQHHVDSVQSLLLLFRFDLERIECGIEFEPIPNCHVIDMDRRGQTSLLDQFEKLGFADVEIGAGAREPHLGADSQAGGLAASWSPELSKLSKPFIGKAPKSSFTHDKPLTFLTISQRHRE